MRYTRIEKYGKDYSQGAAFASNAIYNSQPHVSLQANDKGRSNPFRTKKKELKAGPDSIKYYNVTGDLIILVPETHPLFNLCLGIGDKVKLPPSDIFNNLRKMTAVYVDRLLEKLNTNR